LAILVSFVSEVSDINSFFKRELNFLSFFGEVAGGSEVERKEVLVSYPSLREKG